MNFDDNKYNEYNNIDSNNMEYNYSNHEDTNSGTTLPYLSIMLILVISFCGTCFRVCSSNNPKKIKKIKLNDLNKELIEDCSICLNTFNNNDNIICLPCNHYYHTNCINEWFKRSKTCPKCRIDLV